MAKSGRDRWRWPDKNDLLWYDIDDIITKIKEPKECNSRGAYDVPEIKDFSF